MTASGQGGPLEGAAPDAFWESISAELAESASSTLKNLIAVIKSQAQKKKAIIMISVLMAAIALAPVGNEDNPLGVVNIPAAGVGSPPSEPNTCPPGKQKKTKREFLDL